MHLGKALEVQDLVKAAQSLVSDFVIPAHHFTMAFKFLCLPFKGH